MESERTLIGAWAGLVALSAATTATTMLDVSQDVRWAVAAMVLGLAGAKARLILGRYLGLRQSRFWTHVFDAAIALFLAIAFVLFGMGARS